MPENITLIPRKSSLEMTDQDHRDLASSPPDDLIKNSGKSRGEYMTDKELENYLGEKRRLIDRLGQSKKAFAQSVAKDFQIDFELCIDYLKRIDRLPKSFEQPEK